MRTKAGATVPVSEINLTLLHIRQSSELRLNAQVPDGQGMFASRFHKDFCNTSSSEILETVLTLVFVAAALMVGLLSVVSGLVHSVYQIFFCRFFLECRCFIINSIMPGRVWLMGH